MRNAAFAVAPRYVVEKYIEQRMAAEARHLRRLRTLSDEFSILMEPLSRSHLFRPLQKESEILQLLQIIRALKPAAICEVGAAGCGTTFLFAHATAGRAKIIALDLAFTDARETALYSFALPEEKIISLRGDSHKPETFNRINSALSEDRLDVLYLDGDHSYEGIKADFEMYSPLVRPGGIIVFHDIVPDYRTRYGIETPSNVGGVPQFWAELKATYDVEEVVEDPEQDGYGIGIVRWRSGEVSDAER